MSLGGVFGRGAYADQLMSLLRRQYGVSANQIIRVFNGGADGSLDPQAEPVPIVQPEKIRSGMKALKKNGVDELVYAGDFRFIGKDQNDVESDLTQGQITARVAHAMRIEGMTAVHPGELRRGLRAGVAWIYGPRTLPGRDETEASTLERRLEKLIRLNVRYAQARLRRESPERTVRQAYLFDEAEMVPLPPCDGTDCLLEKAEKLGKETGAVRMLVKLNASKFDPNLDPPVFQQKTLSGATKAKVNLVVLTAREGIIFEQGNVIAECARKGIFVFGYEPIRAPSA